VAARDKLRHPTASARHIGRTGCGISSRRDAADPTCRPASQEKLAKGFRGGRPRFGTTLAVAFSTTFLPSRDQARLFGHALQDVAHRLRSHADLAEGRIDQDAREVQTKFSKSFVTTLLPVGDDIRGWWPIGWSTCGRTSSGDSTIRSFRQPKVAVGDNLRFAAAGLDRKHWSSAGPIRGVFKTAFTVAGTNPSSDCATIIPRMSYRISCPSANGGKSRCPGIA
jgi:hypothetical protein